MSFEFTPKQILALLVPSWQGIRNQRRNAGKGEFFRIAMFGSITFVFGLFVFGGFYRMLLYIGRFSEFTAPLTNQILDTVSTFILTVLFASTVITGTLDAISFGRSITSR